MDILLLFELWLSKIPMNWTMDNQKIELHIHLSLIMDTQQ